MSEMVHPPKSESLRALYWRSEILQVMYWLRGEGFGELVDVSLLERFLGVDAAEGITFLQQLVDDGYLTKAGDLYALSEMGMQEGGLEFVSSFEEMMRPAHGECSPDCWCHNSVEEAQACAAERPHRHDHEHDH